MLHQTIRLWEQGQYQVEETDEGRGQDAHISGWMKLCTEWLQYIFGSSTDEN